MSAGVVLWDFDGTLATRPGLWSACIVEVLDEQAPGHGVSVADVRAAMKDRYPWSRHEAPHPQLADPDAWWQSVGTTIAQALHGCGIEQARCAALAGEVRGRFVDGTRAWTLFDDTLAALERTAAAGWRNVILSNHVPELEALTVQLGLGELVERVFSSALTGFEKPHPGAFRLALAACGEPPARWMVGDNPLADVAGAEALGIPAVLVRSEGAAARRAADALAAAELIVATES